MTQKRLHKHYQFIRYRWEMLWVTVCSLSYQVIYNRFREVSGKFGERTNQPIFQYPNVGKLIDQYKGILRQLKGILRFKHYNNYILAYDF